MVIIIIWIVIQHLAIHNLFNNFLKLQFAVVIINNCSNLWYSKSLKINVWLKLILYFDKKFNEPNDFHSVNDRHSRLSLTLNSLVKGLLNILPTHQCTLLSTMFSEMDRLVHTHVTASSFYRTFHLSTLQSSTFILLSLGRWKYRPRAK